MTRLVERIPEWLLHEGDWTELLMVLREMVSTSPLLRYRGMF